VPELNTLSHFEIAASTAVKWLRRLRETGNAAAKPRGGSTSPLEEHAVVIMALVEEQPDATYAEIFAALAARQMSLALCGLALTLSAPPAQVPAAGVRLNGRDRDTLFSLITDGVIPHGIAEPLEAAAES
jgi:hypothetical protein